jgi:hypothetical protein
MCIRDCGNHIEKSAQKWSFLFLFQAKEISIEIIHVILGFCGEGKESQQHK